MKFVRFGLAAVAFASTAAFSLPSTCVDNQECFIDVPGTQCADGTRSYYGVTKRPGAKKLLIYLQGGGACWDKASCEDGYAWPMTRHEEAEDWEKGTGIQDASDPKNPFAKDYNVVTVRYCTADAYTGNHVVDYGTVKKPYVVHHVGFANMEKILDSVKKEYPSPEKLVMLGCSAGGVGAYVHLKTLADRYPSTKTYVVSDAGLPFRPPYVSAKTYDTVMRNWGAQKNLVVNPRTGKPLAHFGEILQYNTATYPQIRFGLIDGYHDKIMSFFSWALGAPSPLTAVRDILIDAADNWIGRQSPNAKVFYSETETHCHTGQTLSRMQSGKTSLDTWLTALIDDANSWQNERPDLDHAIPPANGKGGLL